MPSLREVGAARGMEPVPAGPVESLLAAYRRWLATERGRVAGSVRWYVRHARAFVSELDEAITMSLARLNAATVTAIMLRCSALSACIDSAKTFVTAVRSLLRFLLVHGLIPAPLTGAVPTVAGRRLSTLPRGLGAEQPEMLLAAHDATTAVGLRDRAVPRRGVGHQAETCSGPRSTTSPSR